MKKFLFAALFTSLAFAMPSCTGGNFDESDAIGSWDVTHYYYQYKEDGVVVDDEENPAPSDERINITIEADGTYIMRYYDEDGLYDSNPGTWNLTGDMLTINEDGDAMIYKVEKLNRTTMVLSFTDHYVEDGITFDDYERMTLKRVK